MSSRIVSRIVAATVALCLLGQFFAPAIAAEAGRPLVLGRISSDPRKHVDRLQAMATYLADRLTDSGISGAEIVVVDSVEAMRDLLRQGKVDLFSETAFAALDISQDNLARPLLREWKNGVAQYHSVIIAREESGLRSLADLQGRRFAFEDAGSTSGYLLPRVVLEDAGLKLVELPGPRHAAPVDALGYSFAQGEVNVVAWVNRGLADAGAISNLDWNDPKASPALLRNGLTIIYETEPIIRSIMMVRNSLDADLAASIASILEGMHEDEEGRVVLKQYFKVARYDRIEGEAVRSMETARKVWLHFRESGH